MDVLIEKLNGERKKFSEVGLIARDFLVSSTNVRPNYSEQQGRPGRIDKGADHGIKTITVPFMFKGNDLIAYAEKRDEVFTWLGGVEPFWIYEGRSLGLVDFEAPGQGGEFTNFESEILFDKRYFVRRMGTLAPDQVGKWGFDSLYLETVELPFAETPKTTLEKDAENYTFVNPTTIQVLNSGTEKVDPEEGMHLVIKYQGESTDLTLRNLTNGSKWSFEGSSVGNDLIKIDGIHSTLNELSIVRNTDLELLTLEPGMNTIEVAGATNGTLSFDFKFYYR